MSAEQPFEPQTIVVTTAGSAPTAGTILRLRRNGYRVVATDIDATAPGLYLADRSYIVAPGDTDDFLADIRAICVKEEAQALVPLVDEELVAATELEDAGVVVLLPRREFVSLCLDKYVLMRRLEAMGLPVPRTRLATEWSGDVEFPLVVKPRRGRGSRGVSTCTSPTELRQLLKDSPYAADELICQTRVPGTEFTVSVVVWRDGVVQAVVPKEVILKRGVTQFAVTRRNERITRMCRQVQQRLRADGPFNVQLALDDAGEPYIFEINPRFSSTTALTSAAGVDEVAGLLDQELRGGSRLQDEWRTGLAMVRRCADEFLDEERFAAHGLLASHTTPTDNAGPVADVAE
ncbi:ATP-grasp domain-containing protein [Salinactinospora qingdaonensis]|uniref:ATP-grasp domain-containing protein n=1 Tax=Salinactinospora qingdaonensis TaxID=702744 RepID=A0ABP7ERM4_9ACTN